MSERCNNPMCLDIERRYADSVSRERYQERCNDIVTLERQLKEAKEQLSAFQHTKPDDIVASWNYIDKNFKDPNKIRSAANKAIGQLQQQLQEANERIKEYQEHSKGWLKHDEELTQLRQERDELAECVEMNFEWGKQWNDLAIEVQNERNTLREQLTQEGLDHIATKQEVENLKDERDTLAKRVQELEKEIQGMIEDNAGIDI